MQVRVVTEQVVRALVSPAEAVTAVRESLVQLAQGT